MSRGAGPQRLQAWGGLILFVGAGLWLVYKVVVFLLPILAAAVVALLGLGLLRRALRGSRSSSSSSS